MTQIIGRKPVLEALKANVKIERIQIAFGHTGDVINQIKAIAYKKGIRLNIVSPAKLLPEIRTQGIVAYKAEIKYHSFDEIISTSLKNKFPLILILEHIQDTHNLGAILRTAEAARVDGVLITKHESAPLNETVSKTSAGAVSHLKIAEISSLTNVIKILKESGFWIYGTSLNASKNYFEEKFTNPTALILGNEEKGLKKNTEALCDSLIKIPMLGKIQSLNVSVSAGIFLFEITRQKIQSSLI